MPNNRPIWNSLRGHGAFARVLAQGKAFSSGSLRCFVVAEPQATRGLRIGFGITRSVRSAVERNRIRRLLRESVRLHQQRIVGQRNGEPISAEIVLMYVGRPGRGGRSLRLSDIENSVSELLSSVASFCEAGNRRAGSSAD